MSSTYIKNYFKRINKKKKNKKEENTNKEYRKPYLTIPSKKEEKFKNLKGKNKMLK